MKQLLPCMVLLLISCTKPTDTVPTVFKKIDSDESGIIFANKLTGESGLNIIDYLYYYNGGGVAVGDLNNDGLEDLFFTANEGSSALYLNLGNLQFKEITDDARVSIAPGWTTGVTMADVNADGWLDIYVCRVGAFGGLNGHNLLFINNGNLTFTEVSAAWGLNFKGFSTQAAFFDYDGDDDLDMYLLNHAVHTTRSYGPAASRTFFDSLAGDRLFQNQMSEGAAHFVDVSEEAGIFSSPQGYGLGLALADIDGNGWTDIYVGNDFHEDDYLYFNQGDGTFVENGAEWLGHTSRFTMGVDIADVNADGLPDIFSLDMLPGDATILLKSGGEDENKVAEVKLAYGYRHQSARNAFQVHQGYHFAEVAQLAGVHATDWSWSVLLQDFDNDGQTDIFITNGIFKRPNDLDYIHFLSSTSFPAGDVPMTASLKEQLIGKMPTLQIRNQLFRNAGGLVFEEVAAQWGMDDYTYSNGAVYADLDLDGDLDLVINNLNQEALLYANQTADLKHNHYLQIQLLDSGNNRYGLGARVSVYQSGQWQTKEVAASRGFQSAVSHRLHFGLGTKLQVDSVVVRWPDRTLQTLHELRADTLLTVAKAARLVFGGISKNMAVQWDTLPFHHHENAFFDYDRETLIPQLLSREGPAFVAADFNDDGQLDVFLGGAAGQVSRVLLADGRGGFSESENPEWKDDRAQEHVSAAAFDFDRDGDLDLYVVAAGNEHAEGSALLEDRLYLNDGNGRFTSAGIRLPTNNGGVVRATDWNGDGFTDLFVGGRSVPGEYGRSPESYWLQNVEGKGLKVVQTEELGMIRDAVWHDLDGDGLQELVACGDWMPITVFAFVKGRFVQQWNELAHSSGFWGSVEVADVNGDGQPDIVAGNHGLNSKWKANAKQSLHLFLDDFDANGQSDPVIFYWEGDQFIPFATRDALAKQMPYLKKEFLSYERFAQVRSILDLTGKSEQEIATILTVNELRSGVFFGGSNGFRFVPFPAEAQWSVISDTYITESEIRFVGNNFAFVPALGRSDARSAGIVRWSNGQFTFAKWGSVPNNQEFRHINLLGNDKFVLVPNSDAPVVQRTLTF